MSTKRPSCGLWFRGLGFAASCPAPLRKFDIALVRSTDYQTMQDRVQHPGSPPYAHTMLSRARLDNLQHCVERMLIDDVPGDLAETGIWRGGAVALMLGILKAYGAQDRRVWA